MSFPAYATNHNPEHFVDTFATYAGDTPATTHGASKRSSHNGRALQKWNTALRVLTCLFALAAVLSIVFAKQTAHDWTMEYTATSAFVFFMVVNAVVAVYAFVSSVIAILMCINGSSVSSPGQMMWTTLILDLIGVIFLLLAFASALATEVISKKGYYVSDEQDDGSYETHLSIGVCKWYGTFCTLVEVSLGFCGATIITFIAGTALDGYYLHLRRV